MGRDGLADPGAPAVLRTIHLCNSRVRRCRSRPCRVIGLQGPSRPQGYVPEPCRVMTPGGAGPAAAAEPAGRKTGWAGGQRNRSHPAVRGQVFSCPWLSGSRGARTCSGRRRPETCLVARIRWSTRLTRVEGERSVKPSAQPTLVRTQHLPPPAKTPPWLRILALAGRFFSVPACVTLSRCRSSYCAVHGRIADGRPCCKDGRYAQLRRSACTVAAVGAHRRLFHGRPRTGRADRIFPGLKVNGGAGRASPVAARRSARLPGASRPDETGDRRQCSLRALPRVGRQLSGSRRYPGPSA